MNNTTGRILIAGTASGCGKTSVVCALLRAFPEKEGFPLPPANAGRITLTLSSMRGFWEFRQKIWISFSIHPRYSGGCFRSMEKGKIW
ncbi:MAG: hypothetical protein ACLUUO_00490 [Sellimonas intestinalis]